jgi:hypothetical protein
MGEVSYQRPEEIIDGKTFPEQVSFYCDTFIGVINLYVVELNSRILTQPSLTPDPRTLTPLVLIIDTPWDLNTPLQFS